MNSLIRTAVAALAAAATLATLATAGAAEAKLRVLVLSGSNNHDWKQTTPVIKAVLEETGRFTVDVTEDVPNLKPDAFAPYAVILSNYNDFGKNPPVSLSPATKQAFLDHLAKGHGFLALHAGSSVFYDWPEFQTYCCGTWKDGTSHGAIHVNEVTFSGAKSPITEGLKPFWIRDEFWQEIHVAPGVKSHATVTPDPKSNGSGKPEMILFTIETGGGRGCGYFLGHGTTTMKNTAWQTLLQRAVEWTATGKVTLPPAKDWPATKADAERMMK
ncbi:MAG: ThuA domain-containing protein [Akkermansiaceae bacterium]|nr:ThuA domain-containing protein [Akkermansiaceae bacterium]